MIKSPSPWLSWSREIFSLAQAGLTYGKNEFDLYRYRRLQEIIAAQSGLEKEVALKSFSMQAGYPTPKIDVRGAVIRDDKILFVQERVDGRWSMPGGWADLGDSPSEMVVREVREESGFKVKVKKVIAVYDANRLQPMEFYHAYKLIFHCEMIGGEAQTSNETLAVDFFDPARLPDLSLMRTTMRMIEEAFAHAKDENRKTAFD